MNNLRSKKIITLGVAAGFAAAVFSTTLLVPGPSAWAEPKAGAAATDQRVVELDPFIELPPYQTVPSLAVEGHEPPQGVSETIFVSDDEKLKISVFEAPPGLVQLSDYSVDEYWVLVEGEVSFTDQDGERHEFSAGDLLAIPSGYTGRSEITKKMRKLAISYTPQADVKAKKPGKVISLDSNPDLPPAKPVPSLALEGHDVPTGSSKQLYTSADGNVKISVFAADPAMIGLKDYPIYEFWYLAEGEVGFDSGVGGEQVINKGDFIVLPKGYTGTSEIKDRMRKVSISYSGDGK